MSTMPTKSQLKKNLRALVARLELKPMDLDARMRVARTYRLLGDKKNAVAHYRTVARYLSLSAQPLQAVAVLKELLQVDPKHEETLLFLAKLYARAGIGDGVNGRVATPVLVQHRGGSLALPEGLPGSPTGIWQAIRARSTDVHLAAATADRPSPADELSVADELRELENTFELDEADVLEERALSMPSGTHADDGVDPMSVVPDVEGYEILGHLGTEDVLLPQVPLFSSLSPNAFIELGHAMVFQRAKAGDTIFDEGDLGDSCIVISRGQLKAIRRSDDGNIVELMTLSEGDLAGIFALMSSEKRQASLVAETDCEYFEIDRLAVTALVEKMPAMATELRKFFKERLLLNALAVLPHFTLLDAGARQTIAAQFVDREYDVDDELFYEGEGRAGIWILLDGEVKISSERGGSVARLVGGDFIGSFAGVAEDNGAELSATATRLTHAVLLPHKVVEDILDARDASDDDIHQEFEKADMMLTENVFAGNARVAGNLVRLDRTAA